jgi:non-reducing end alpha-L-arabinofuranosidase
MNGQGVSLQSFIFRDKFIRHFFFLGFIASEDGSNPWDANAFFRDDVSWIVSPPWAP